MKKLLLCALLCSCAISSGQNLLVNGSAEIFDNGAIQNWMPTIGGTWLVSGYTVYPQVATETADIQFFYPGNNYALENGFNTSELSQTIDISADSTAIDSGAMNYYFDGYVISFNQAPADQSNIFIDFFDATDFLLSTTHFGPFDNVQAWNHLTETIPAPENARKARVRLRSVLINGSSCDGLYEDLYFATSPRLNVGNLKIPNAVVYPNPTSSDLHILIPNVEIDQIAITDLSGKTMLERDAPGNVIDISVLSSGVYVVRVLSGKQVWRQKFVKN